MNRTYILFLLFIAIGLLLFASCGGCKSTNQPNPDIAAESQKESSNPFDAVAIQSSGLFSLPPRLGNSQGLFHAKDLQLATKGETWKRKVNAWFMDPVRFMVEQAKGEINGKIVALCSREGYSLIVRDGEYKKPIELAAYDLAMTFENNMENFILHRFLKEHKLDGKVYLHSFNSYDPKEYSHVQKSFENPTFDTFSRYFFHLVHVERTLAGYMDGEPYTTMAIAKDNTGIIATSADIAPGCPTLCLVIDSNQIQQNREGVAKLVGEHINSINWMQSNPDETVAWVSSTYKISLKQAKDSLSRIKFDYRFQAKELEKIARFVNEMEYGNIADTASFVAAISDTSFLPGVQ